VKTDRTTGTTVTTIPGVSITGARLGVDPEPGPAGLAPYEYAQVGTRGKAL
jgi:hypothetical protein